MQKSTFLIITLIFTAIFQFQASAQSNQKHLYQVGVTDSLYSKVLNEQRKIWVQVPDDYNPKSDKKYPVIYVLDGSVQMRGLETVHNYYWGHFMPTAILVGISNQTNRTRDFTTSEITTRRGAVVQEETGKAEVFTEFIEKELIPYIDTQYKTSPYRTLIGHSYGGLFTINMLINHSHVFENYVSIDPSLDWDNQKLLKEAKLKLQNSKFTGKSLFVSLSAASIHMQNEKITMNNVMQDTTDYTLFTRSIIEFSKFAESQKQNDLNFSWKHYQNDLHGTVPLISMRDALIFTFEWYQFKSFTKFNNPSTSINDLIAILKNREKILSKHFGEPTLPMDEQQLNMMGYMVLQFGQPEKSKAFFELNMEYYPKSANVYDAMADYYEAQKDKPKALEYVRKAFEISGNEYHKKRIKDLEK
jgi:predicted alpha/beta superfamily hydrolase